MEKILFSLFMSQNVWLSACLRFPSHGFLDFVCQPQSAWEDWENQIKTEYYRGMLFSGNKKRPELEKQQDQSGERWRPVSFILLRKKKKLNKPLREILWNICFQSSDFCDASSVVLKQGRFCPPKDIWQCLETFLVVTSSERDGLSDGSQGYC